MTSKNLYFLLYLQRIKQQVYLTDSQKSKWIEGYQMPKIHMSLHRNKKQTVETSQYNWSSLANCDIRNQYTLTVRNKFDTIQETSASHTLNDKYENFVTSHKEAAGECITTKPRPSVEFHESQ